MDDEKLMECVKKHAALYDMAHPKYLDNNHKSSLWKLIAENMNEPDELVCKKRWINIRDQFRKSLNRRKTQSGLAASQKKYKYEETLQFLIPHILDRSTIPNADTPEDHRWQSYNEHHLQSLAEVDEPNTDHEMNDNIVEQHPPKLLLKQKKRNETATESAPETLIKYVIANNSKQKTWYDKHPIDAFLQGLAPTLKNLPPYYQHLAKGKIFSVVQDMEAAAFYSSYSPPIGTPHSSNSIGSSCCNEHSPAENDHS